MMSDFLDDDRVHQIAQRDAGSNPVVEQRIPVHEISGGKYPDNQIDCLGSGRP